MKHKSAQEYMVNCLLDIYDEVSDKRGMIDREEFLKVLNTGKLTNYSRAYYRQKDWEYKTSNVVFDSLNLDFVKDRMSKETIKDLIKMKKFDVDNMRKYLNWGVGMIELFKEHNPEVKI